jgi:hypothetical protein
VSDPVLISTEHYSDTTNMLHMSDESVIFGCRWPGCNFVSGNAQSVPSHYRAHTGRAAQKRRAKRRPHHAEIHNEVLEAALSLFDRVQDLIDKLDAFDAEHTSVRRQLDAAKVKIEEYREREELASEITDDIRDKAAKYDALMVVLRDATSS